MNSILDRVLIFVWRLLAPWIRGVEVLMLIWWKAMQIGYLNLFVYVGTIGMVSALPVWVYRLFGGVGLQWYFVGLAIVIVSCVIALLARSFRETDHKEVAPC